MLGAEEKQSESRAEEMSSKMYQQQQFVLISGAYSDGVTLQKEGPVIKKEFISECVWDNGRTYRTAATFVPKLVAKHFVTTLTVADELTYYESIAFERRTVLKNFSESTNIFMPKEKINKYCSSLFFDPDATTRHYITGVELLPAQKIVVTEEFFDDGDATGCDEKSAINGDICHQLINGEV